MPCNIMPSIDTLQSSMFDRANILKFGIRIPGDSTSVLCFWACFCRALSDGTVKLKLHSAVDAESEINRQNYNLCIHVCK